MADNQERDGWADDDDGEELEDGDEPEGPSPEEQARIDAAVAAARTEERQRIAAAAREQGLMISGDEKPSFGLGDVNRAASWLSGPERAQAQPAASAAAPAEQPDPEPDEFDDPKEHLRWVIRQETKAVRREFEEQTRALRQENAELRGYVTGREHRDAVDHRVRAAVEKHNPLLAPLLEHPDFADQFRQNTANAKPDQLADPVWLAAAAGFVAPLLDHTLLPKPEARRERDESGRFTGSDDVYRMGREAAGQGYGTERPPRGGGAGTQFHGKEAKMMQVLSREEFGGPPSEEEWDALEGNSKQYAEAMKRAKERQKVRGRR